MTVQVIDSAATLNKKHKKEHVYMLFTSEEFVATTTKYALEEHLKSAESIVTLDDDLSDVCLLFGLLLDPSDLPFEISDDVLEKHSLWMIVDLGVELSVSQFSELSELITEIEFLLHEDETLSIENICVILGSQVELTLTPIEAGTRITSKNGLV